MRLHGMMKIVISELILFRNHRQSSPCSMELADGVNGFNDSFPAVITAVLTLEVDDSDVVSHFDFFTHVFQMLKWETSPSRPIVSLRQQSCSISLWI